MLAFTRSHSAEALPPPTHTTSFGRPLPPSADSASSAASDQPSITARYTCAAVWPALWPKNAPPRREPNPGGI